MLTYGIPPEFRGGVHLLSVHIMCYEWGMQQYIYVHTMYDDISSTVIMPAHKIKAPREDLEIQ